MKRCNGNLIGRLLLAGALVAGLGCSKELEQNPKRYSQVEGAFVQPYVGGGRDTLYIFDVDGSIAIAEGRGQAARYVESDFSGVQVVKKGPNTRIMTPTEVAAARKALKADRDLAKLLAQKRN